MFIITTTYKKMLKNQCYNTNNAILLFVQLIPLSYLIRQEGESWKYIRGAYYQAIDREWKIRKI